MNKLKITFLFISTLCSNIAIGQVAGKYGIFQENSFRPRRVSQRGPCAKRQVAKRDEQGLAKGMAAAGSTP